MDTEKRRIRPEKESVVAELRDRVSASGIIVFADNAGMTVEKTVALRRRLRGVGARYQVVPNGLIARAARQAGAPVAEGLSGSTGAVFGADPVETSRALWDFVRENERPAIRRVALDGVARPASTVEEMAKLPDRPVLLSIFLGTLNAPMRNLAGALHQKLSSLVYVLQAACDKREAHAG